MVKNVVAGLALAVAVLMGVPARAHHSVNAEFDVSKKLEITGTLTKLENINPHSWWHVTVKDAKGKEQAWRLESLAPGGLIRQGLKVKTDLKIGDAYTFKIVPAWKDPADAKMGWITAVVVNGKEFVVVEL